MTADVIPTWSMPFVAGAQGPTGPQGPMGLQGVIGPGADGTDGLRGPSIQLIYQVAATAPAAASSGAGIDADGVLNAAPAGWALVASVPPVGQFLWVQVLIVESDNTIQYGGVSRWTGEIGATGSTGQRGQSIQYVYQAAATAPAPASSGAVVDSDGLLTTAPPGWALDPPTPATGEQVYAQEITVDGANAIAYGVVAPWSGPVGQDGATWTVGPAFPANPGDGDQHLFNVAVTGIAQTYVDSGGNALTSADAGDWAVYEESNTRWVLQGSLIGSQGPQGIQGQTGQQGTQGIQGIAGDDGTLLDRWEQLPEQSERSRPASVQCRRDRTEYLRRRE